MRKYLPFAALLVLALASISFAQEPTPSPSPKPKPRVSKAQLLRQLSAAENKLWDAWKNKDPKPFMAALSANSVLVDGTGVAEKKTIGDAMANMPCEVKSFALSDWKITLLDANHVLLNYKAAADGTCMGTAIPTVWASSLWMRQGGKWRAAFHQETPMMP